MKFLTKFDFNTIDNFDKHIDLSIPDYGLLNNHISSLSTFFIKDNGLYYDIGASTGILIDKIKNKNSNINYRSIGIEPSKNLSNNHPDIIIDKAENIEYKDFDFATAVFTFQFLSIENRFIILKKLHNKLKRFGCIIIAEKVIEDVGYIQNILEFTYYDYKLLNFSSDEIFNKQNDLRYIMNPITEQENISLFKEAGFIRITKFWQSLLFRAWILQ
jgi:tRNA (cmo5U34)-methyltransferase